MKIQAAKTKQKSNNLFPTKSSNQLRKVREIAGLLYKAKCHPYPLHHLAAPL